MAPISRTAERNAFAPHRPESGRGLGIVAGIATESQTHIVGLLERAPAAFWCARAIGPSMQANASFGIP
jgi:hypothetical protein